MSEPSYSYQNTRNKQQKEIYIWKGKFVLVLEREKIALQRKLGYKG